MLTSILPMELLRFADTGASNTRELAFAYGDP